MRLGVLGFGRDDHGIFEIIRLCLEFLMAVCHSSVSGGVRGIGVRLKLVRIDRNEHRGLPNEHNRSPGVMCADRCDRFCSKTTCGCCRKANRHIGRVFSAWMSYQRSDSPRIGVNARRLRRARMSDGRDMLRHAGSSSIIPCLAVEPV